jgi:hypothetical protein
MSVQRDVLGTTTVDCPADEDCGGRITLTVVREYQVLPSGSDAMTIHVEDVGQTCACDLSHFERGEVVDRAQRDLELR